MRKLIGASMFVLAVSGAATMMLTPACGTPNVVRGVKMALDQSGNRTRKVFYPDSTQIVCVVDYIGDRQDITVDAIMHQRTGLPCDLVTLASGGASGCESLADATAAWKAQTTNFPAVNHVLGVVEQAPGQGALTLGFAFTLQGAPTLPDGGPIVPPPGMSPTGTIPFPVGEYTCEIWVDGVKQGSADFSVIYPYDNVAGGGPTGAPRNVSCPSTPVIPGNICVNFVAPPPDSSSCHTYDQSTSCSCDDGVWACK